MTRMQGLLDRLCWGLVHSFPYRHKLVYTDGEKYLLRFYLKRNGILPGLYLHKFFQGDQDRELHDHPWSRSLSFILTGGYDEERLIEGQVETRRVRPGMFNFIKGTSFHRVSLVDETGGAWTLFCSGPKVKGWGFRYEDGTVVPNEEYLANR